MNRPLACREIEDRLALYLYGELNAAEEDAVESHCAACEPCASALARQRNMHAAVDRAEPEVPAMLLASCRRDLRQSLDTKAAPRPAWRAWAGPWWWQPAAGLALVALGFFGGRLGQVPSAVVAKDVAAPAEAVMTRVRDVNTDAEGRVRLVLEETRQRTVDGSADDEGIKLLLLAAAQDPSDAGLRFESVELLRRHSAGADVRRALMAALERDPNPGVRLKAMEGLRPYASQPDVRRLFAETLERDENPGIRTQAVDSLIEHGQKDVVDVLQRLMQREQNGYIRSRSRNALEAINASVETF